MSFASEPGRDDGSLPPANFEVPDDARDLARDVIAYHRELRAKRRRERVARLLRPLARAGFFRFGTFFPLIAILVALSVVIGAVMSVMAVSPTSSPVTDMTPPSASSLPKDAVRLDGELMPARSLAGSVLVLTPSTCGCGTVLSGIARQAAGAHVPVYFVYALGNAAGAARTATVTADYGDGVARSVYDVGGVLFLEYAPTSPVALIVARDGKVDVRGDFPPRFDLTPALRPLKGTH